MNAVKRAARRYHYGKQYGTDNGIKLSDNRNFRERKPLIKDGVVIGFGDLLTNYDARYKLEYNLDQLKTKQWEANLDLIQKAMMGPGIQDLSLRYEVQMSGSLYELSDGQLQVLADKVRALDNPVKETYKPLVRRGRTPGSRRQTNLTFGSKVSK